MAQATALECGLHSSFARGTVISTAHFKKGAAAEPLSALGITAFPFSVILSVRFIS